MAAWGEAIYVIDELSSQMSETNRAAAEVVTQLEQLESDVDNRLDQLNTDTQTSLNNIKEQASQDLTNLADDVDGKVDDKLSEITTALNNFKDIVISTMPIVANNLGTSDNPNPGLSYTPYDGTQWFVTKDN